MRISDSVRNLLRQAARAERWQLEMILTLIRERRRMVLSELQFERMFMPDLLPPLINGEIYALDYAFEDNHAIRVYNSLLELLEEAEKNTLERMGDQNIQLPASEL